MRRVRLAVGVAGALLLALTGCGLIGQPQGEADGPRAVEGPVEGFAVSPAGGPAETPADGSTESPVHGPVETPADVSAETPADTVVEEELSLEANADASPSQASPSAQPVQAVDPDPGARAPASSDETAQTADRASQARTSSTPRGGIAAFGEPPDYYLPDLFTSNVVGNGVVQTSNQSTLGPDMCTAFGDPYTPNAATGNNGAPNPWWDELEGVYHYRIRVPRAFVENRDTLRVEILDPDSFNAANATVTVTHEDLTTEDIDMDGNRRDARLEDINDVHSPNNDFWFHRIDEIRGTGTPGLCGAPGSYDPETGVSGDLETSVEFTLFYYQEQGGGSLVRQDLARYTSPRSGVDTPPSGHPSANQHCTDRRWVSPGSLANQGSDFPAATCPQGVPADGQVHSPYAFTPDVGNGDFEIALPNVDYDNQTCAGGEMPDCTLDPLSDDIYLYLDVRGVAGASENGFEFWAGPDLTVYDIPTEMNDRNVYVLTHDWYTSHSSEGVVVLGIGHLPLNSNTADLVDIPLAYIGPELAGQTVRINLFDPDSGSEGPITFFFDSVDEEDWSYVTCDDDTPGAPLCDQPAGQQNSPGQYIGDGERNNQWIDPPFEFVVPAEVGTPLVPFGGGVLTARYKAGFQDTYGWVVEVESPGPPPLVAVVNSVADTDDGACDPLPDDCTLREAINAVNATPGTDTITFDIPGTGPYIIQLASQLPTITDPVMIDGWSQPGYVDEPVIILDGQVSGGPPEIRGLVITAADSVVRGIRLYQLADHCVHITGAGANGNWLYDNDIGPCYDSGVHIDGGASSNIVGTDGDSVGDAGESNYFWGSDSGVAITGAGTDHNVVAGNFIGRGRDGYYAGIETNGVLIDDGAQSNLVGTDGDGTSDDAERNVIASANQGIYITGVDTNSNVVAGNYIGTDADSTCCGAGDQWPENRWAGVQILGGDPDSGRVASPQFNIVGTDGDGVADDAERNVISGNQYHGVSIAGVGADNNTVAGNYVGTDVAGTGALPNGVTGITIADGAQHNVVGTDGDGVADEAERNIVSSNGSLEPGSGVEIFGSGTDHNVVAGNYIGTDVNGTSALPNIYDGVAIRYGAQFNRVGTDGDGVVDDAERNVISGNGTAVWIGGTGADNNVVAGNFIGMDATGDDPLPNTLGVVVEDGAANNRVGGTLPAQGNLISGNDSGVAIGANGAPATGNLVQGNQIGGCLSTPACPGNTLYGILIEDGVSNVIGGTDPGAVNVIVNNTGPGIEISGSLATGNLVQGNLIGSDGSVDGNCVPIPWANADYGVLIADSAHDNSVGGSASGAGNLIVGGTLGDVVVESGTGNEISGNSITRGLACDLGIDLGNDGSTANDPGDGDSGANNLQNYPVLTQAASTGPSLTVDGTLDSSPDTTFRLEFYADTYCGEPFLGAADVTTDGGGSASFSVPFAAAVPGGHFVTATATDPNGNTSEFAACREVVACYTLTTNAVPAGGGTVSADPAPNCNGGTGYWDGTVVELTATTGPGYTFTDWSGDASGTDNPVSVTVDGDKSVTANFTFEPIEDPLPIGDVEIDVGDGLPARVEVRIDGHLPDTCTRLGSVEQDRVGNNVEVLVLTTRPPDRVCAQKVTPYSFVVALDGEFSAGDYTLTLNGEVFDFGVP